ncbi:tRNA (adenosine(37)-N6)-dimethylallyltransferase MiaA [Ferrimicrobium sp.]|uniref:tRNA (adenosine(37)-N6)-dimethylallyltransferase MiaA n=1 Tax=Ferrimicrobium sp. TaxID=2926050 RepID=UPI002632D2AD|nr:tRNA (adenosine(37)-N6)-dimethylallyltransferase MiaA [Ferrimicrobium sp.]
MIDWAGEGGRTRKLTGVAVVGPTASGKTEFAHTLAHRRRDLVPIAVDALTVYEALPITTAMPEPTAIAELGYRCVAHVPVDKEYSLGQFLQDLDRELCRLSEAGQRPLFVGGTALWIRAVVNGFTPPKGAPGLRGWLETRLRDDADDQSAYHLLAQLDPRAGELVDPRNRRRLLRALEVALASGGAESVAGDRLGVDGPQRYPQIGLALEPEVLACRISLRIEQQIARGWVDEIARVLAMDPSRTARVAIGVTELGDYLAGKSSLDEAIELIARRTRRLVKRQLSWLRRDPRIVWVSSIDEGLDQADRLLDQIVSGHWNPDAIDGTRRVAGLFEEGPVEEGPAEEGLAEESRIENGLGEIDPACAAPTAGEPYGGRNVQRVEPARAQDNSIGEGETLRGVFRPQIVERRDGELQVVKYTGAGNDFLIGEMPSQLPDSVMISALLDRSHGVGADGLILVEVAKGAQPRMHLYNQDGSRAEMSGNGLRCLGHYLVERHGLGPALSIMTDAGLRHYRLVEQGNWAWLGETTMGVVEMTIEPDGSFLVDVGNPHRVIVMGGLAELEGLDIAAEGAKYQGLALATDGINVEWIVRSEDGCVMRVFERGVGPTMACGTGSVAAAWVARHLGWIRERAVVENPGGELAVHFGSSSTNALATDNGDEHGAPARLRAAADLDEPAGAGQADPEVWLRGPSLLIADITPARWLFSS